MDLILVVDDELSMFARHREQVDPDIAILRPERQTPWIQTRARAHTHTSHADGQISAMTPESRVVAS